MVRTSLALPNTLHQRLIMSAREENTTISKLVCEILDRTLAVRENIRLKRMYAALDKLKGIGSPDITDASTTINETLYGEHGAWRPTEQ